MLVLGRKTDETIHIGDDIVITVVRIGPGVVRLGIEAGDRHIVRGELLDADGKKKPLVTKGSE